MLEKSFGETALNFGRVAKNLGENFGWIPGVGMISSEVKKIL